MGQESSARESAWTLSLGQESKNTGHEWRWAGRQDRGQKRRGRHSPWRRGQIFLQAVTLPWLLYWPSATSRKNTGMPQLKKKMKYGMKKAPERERERQSLSQLLLPDLEPHSSISTLNLLSRSAQDLQCVPLPCTCCQGCPAEDPDMPTTTPTHTNTISQAKSLEEKKLLWRWELE